jgi:catechol 2,3-dioxygenase-like lactoylglutathione lyase family enzyme
MMEKCLISTNTILYCKNWEQTVAFFRDHLKLPILFDTDWFVEFGLTSLSRLSIADEKRSSIKGCGGIGITLALEVSNIKAVWSHMEEMGLKPTQLRKHPWDARVFYIFDPEGHRIEIWQSFHNNKARNRNPNQQ